MSDILNRDYPAKKRGRKRKLSAEEGARQIMDLLQEDTPPEPTDCAAEEAERVTEEHGVVVSADPDASARVQIDSSLKTAVACMKDAARTMSKALTELRNVRAENGRLRRRLREQEEELRSLRRWRDIGNRISEAMREAEEDRTQSGEAVPDGAENDA